MVTNILIAVTLTCYHAVEAQCNANYLKTASGANIESTETAYKHRYIAVSRDLLEEYPYGTVVTIDSCSISEYNGEWIVQDTMNKRWRNAVDILINPGMRLTKEKVSITKKDDKHDGQDKTSWYTYECTRKTGSEHRGSYYQSARSFNPQPFVGVKRVVGM